MLFTKQYHVSRNVCICCFVDVDSCCRESLVGSDSTYIFHNIRTSNINIQ